MTTPPSTQGFHARQAAIGFAVCMCLVLKQLAGLVACVCLATGSPAQAVHQGEHAHLDSGGRAHEVHGASECSHEQSCGDQDQGHDPHSCEQHLPHSFGDHEGSLIGNDSSNNGPLLILALVSDRRSHLTFTGPSGFSAGPLGKHPPGPPPPGRTRPRAPPLPF